MKIAASCGNAPKTESLETSVYSLKLTAQTNGERRWLAGLYKCLRNHKRPAKHPEGSINDLPPAEPLKMLPTPTDTNGKPIVLQDYVASEIVGVQIGVQGHKLWVCIDGVAVLRVNSPSIVLEDMRNV